MHTIVNGNTANVNGIDDSFAFTTFVAPISGEASTGTAVSGSAATGSSNTVTQTGAPASSSRSFGTTMIVSESGNVVGSTSTDSSTPPTQTGSNSGAGRKGGGALVGVALLAAAL
jgi:hypothetical protein